MYFTGSPCEKTTLMRWTGPSTSLIPLPRCCSLRSPHTARHAPISAGYADAMPQLMQRSRQLVEGSPR